MDHTIDTQDTHSREPSRAALQIAKYAQTARATGNAHARTLLMWVWQWRLIDSHIVRELLGASRSSSYRILARLRRLGLLRPVPVSGTPASPWMLTPEGADAIAAHLNHDDLELSPVTAPDRLRLAQVPHDLLVQHFALRLTHTPPKVITDLIARRRAEVTAEVCYALGDGEVVIHPATLFEMLEIRIAGKYPDAVIEYVIDRSSGTSVLLAIECQQTPEPHHVRERIMAGYCEALGADRKDNQWAGIDAVVWCSTRAGIPPLYQSVLGPDLTSWYRTDSRHWIRVPNTHPYRQWMTDRMMAVNAPDLEACYYHLRLGR